MNDTTFVMSGTTDEVSGEAQTLNLLSRWGDSDLNEFCDSNSEWVKARFQESDVIFMLPIDDENSIYWEHLLNISGEDFNIEKQFSQICRRMVIAGINRREPIRSCLSLKPNNTLDSEQLESGFNLGWSTTDYDELNKLVIEVDDIRERMKGAAGWMICNAGFREERDRLKNQWEQLPDSVRPVFPLTRTPQLLLAPPEYEKLEPSKEIEFIHAFDQFCDRWRLLGMTTRDLPDPHGLKTFGFLLGHAAPKEGEFIQDIPWHFPLLESDGFGKRINERHTQQAGAHGFVDQGKWQCYAHILAIHHWEQTIRLRYADVDAPAKFVEKLFSVLESVLDLKSDRIKKLRSALTSFLRVERTSLDEFR